MLCWPFANAPKSVARIKPQYAKNLGLQIISRPRQGPMSSPPQCHSLRALLTAAIGAMRLRADPSSPARARDGRRRMFQQRRPHLEAILTPACGSQAASRASPLIAARSSSPLHRSLSRRVQPPRQPPRIVGGARGHHGWRLKRPRYWRTASWVE